MKLIPTIYYYWQLRFAESGVISVDQAKELLSKYCIPRKLRGIILGEMELCGLIRIDDSSGAMRVIHCPYKKDGMINLDRVAKRGKQVEIVLKKNGTIFEY
ncbi:hypothetical protein M0R04_14805 [Candidatus Dojkabacteria bacterium]|nr:hypothetical protein [Candidatus Dojkabacteria bacterium]